MLLFDFQRPRIPFLIICALKAHIEKNFLDICYLLTWNLIITLNWTPSSSLNRIPIVYTELNFTLSFWYLADPSDEHMWVRRSFRPLPMHLPVDQAGVCMVPGLPFVPDCRCGCHSWVGMCCVLNSLIAVCVLWFSRVVVLEWSSCWTCQHRLNSYPGNRL